MIQCILMEHIIACDFYLHVLNISEDSDIIFWFMYYVIFSCFIVSLLICMWVGNKLIVIHCRMSHQHAISYLYHTNISYIYHTNIWYLYHSNISYLYHTNMWYHIFITPTCDIFITATCDIFITATCDIFITATCDVFVAPTHVISL